MLPHTDQCISTGAPAKAQYGTLLRGLDIIGQLALLYLAWTTLEFADTEAMSDRAMLLRMPLVIWQVISLVASAIAYAGYADRRFHRNAVWPVLGALIISAVMIPIGIGIFLIWLWFQLATFLSVPYFVVTVVTFFLNMEQRGTPRRPVGLPMLFLMKQIDLVAQTLCLVIALLLTLTAQRPIHEAFINAYPVLAGLQLISAAAGVLTWNEMGAWRSGLRIPQMFLQVIFGAAVLIQVCVSETFHWRDTLNEPCAQILVATYLLMTYQEWEKLSAALNIHRHKLKQGMAGPGRIPGNH